MKKWLQLKTPVSLKQLKSDSSAANISQGKLQEHGFYI